MSFMEVFAQIDIPAHLYVGRSYRSKYIGFFYLVFIKFIMNTIFFLLKVVFKRYDLHVKQVITSYL